MATSVLSGLRVIAFDAYGTLLNFEAVAKSCASLPRCGLDNPAAWAALSADWRTKQLSYTWLNSLMGAREAGEHHKTFDELTRSALLWSLKKHNKALDETLINELMEAYHRCPAFDDSKGALQALKDSGKYKLCVFSNGSKPMLEAACSAAGIDSLLDALVSVEDQTAGHKYFKPHPSAYKLVADKFGVAPSEVALVSSNTFDIHGASTYGYKAIWVNRQGLPDDEGLTGSPTVQIKDLTELKDVLL